MNIRICIHCPPEAAKSVAAVVAPIVPMRPADAEDVLRKYAGGSDGWWMGSADDPKEIGQIATDLCLAGAVVRLEMDA